MRVFVFVSLISLFAPGFAAAAEVFEFRHVPGARYRILSVVEQAVFINGVLSHRSESLNRVAVEVVDVFDNGTGLHQAVFQTSERVVFDALQGVLPASSAFHFSREYESVFERDRLGRLTIEPQYFMPVVRNVPVFPDRPLRIGDRWHAPAHEVHDFRDGFGIPEPYRIPFNAFYEFLGYRLWRDNFFPAFSVNYNIETRPAPVEGRIFPVRISGTFNQVLFWDRSLGQTVAYEGTFRLAFDLSDGRRIEFRGRAHAEFIEAEEMDREQMALEILEEIQRMEIPDVYVTITDEGISLSLEDIGFHADTSIMLPGEKQKLEQIAQILRMYPDRDILISGHAAPVGSRDFLMRLSQERARTVADFLIARNVRTPDRIVVRGYGADRPIADNSTEEGMRRNRRVEIMILEN